MKLGIASKPFPGMNVNGDAYLVKEWNGKTLLAVIDGLGHGEQASIASGMAKEYALENYVEEVDQIILGIHKYLHKTRGVAAGLVKIDRIVRELSFCGIGNIEVRIVSEPPINPAWLDGIIGYDFRKIMKFTYRYNTLKAVVLHSDGISSRFNLSDYPTIYEEPQMIAQRILVDRGKDHDDATMIIAVEEVDNISAVEIEITDGSKVMVAVGQAKALAKNLGFSEVAQTKIAIATSELARNIAVHTQAKGKIIIRPVVEPAIGLTVIAEDRGPGVENLEKVRSGQIDTRKGLGEGLGSVKRLMDELQIETKMGEGTTITARKWKQ